MRSTVAGGIVAGLSLLSMCSCRSASEGSPAREVAFVAGDVARRAGTPPVIASCDDAATAAACAALSAQPLTEERAVKAALLNNARVREAYERLGIARADLLQAGLVSNPVFTASAKVFSRSGPEVELGLAQSFVELFLLPLRRRVAADDLCAAQAEVTRELVRLVYDVRRALVLVRGAEEVVRVRTEALTAVSSARDLMRKLHDAGNVRGADLTVEEVGAVRARMDMNAAELAAKDARESLNVLLGCADAVPWVVDAGLPALPVPFISKEAQHRALAASLDLLEAKARVQSALATSSLSRRQGVLPHLDLGAVGKREAGDGAWGFGPEISTAIPIFDQGTAKVLAANALARQRLARHEALTVEVAAAARRLTDRAMAMRDREHYMRATYLPLRARLVDETLQTFNAMQIGAFDVLDAKEGEVDARREHTQTLTEAWLAALDLAELLAGSLNRERIEALHMPENAERPIPPKGH